MNQDPRERRSERWVAISFGISMLASIGLVAVYLFGGETQVEGLLLGLALGGMGVGMSIWATALLPAKEVTGPREDMASEPGAAEAARAEITEAKDVTRRTLLVRFLAAAGGTLAGALAIPSLSLGPSPGRDLFQTAWSPGARLVGPEGEPVRPSDLVIGSVITVFPEGSVGSADSQTLLVKVDEALLELAEDRAGWTPGGCVAYSKICTHAGCPVGLYRAESHELLCPCHQSTFDVLRGAIPTFGPADRALPQLALDVDDEGYLVARSDFDSPVGPGFWNISARRRSRRGASGSGGLA